jgi:uncharacterized protein
MENTERILRQFRTIAVVGLSRDPSKAAHAIPARMQRAGYRVIPVNPYVDSVLGEKSYATLADVAEPIEVVLVFRPSAEAGAVAKGAAAVGAKALWLQQGIMSAEARAVADAAGMLYVEDRCMGVERAVHGVVK